MVDQRPSGEQGEPLMETAMFEVLLALHRALQRGETVDVRRARKSTRALYAQAVTAGFAETIDGAHRLTDRGATALAMEQLKRRAGTRQTPEGK